MILNAGTYVYTQMYTSDIGKGGYGQSLAGARPLIRLTRLP